MTLSYRSRRFWKRFFCTLLVLLLLVLAVWLCWVIWLGRYIVYTRDNGAVLDFNLSPQLPQGQPAVEPDPAPTVEILYNGVTEPTEPEKLLPQVAGYYIDEATLLSDPQTVRQQIAQLPAGTAVLLDVKSIRGLYYYETSLPATMDTRAKDADIPGLIRQLVSSDLYLIARIPAFRDYEFGRYHVPCGLPTAGGYLWMDESRCYWLDPSDGEVLTYLVEIVMELRGMGFDEVVFRDFRFPDTEDIVFDGNRDAALAEAAETLVQSCAMDGFAVSFMGSTAFPLPEGRTRLYLSGIAAADIHDAVAQTSTDDPSIHLMFFTAVNDTRFDEHCVLRPLELAH